MTEPNTSLLTDRSVSHYVSEVASGSAAPGGGSATALVGALAAALTEMVARLTLGRVRYESVQQVMEEALGQSTRLRSQLMALAEADITVFSRVMEAHKLPKETRNQVAARDAAIEEALKHAIDIPLATAEACVQVGRLAATVAVSGNKNATADATVAAMLAHSSLQCAILNVRSNLESVRDAEFRAVTEARLAGLAARAEGMAQHDGMSE